MSAIDLYARHTPGFEDRLAHTVQVLKDAAAAHAGRAVQSTSLGVEDMVITDLIARHGLGGSISIATLDTGMLHEPTVALIARIEQRYALSVEVFKPLAERRGLYSPNAAAGRAVGTGFTNLKAAAVAAMR